MRSVLAHAVLAVGGLVLAWLVWVTPEEETTPGEVELVDCDPDDLRAVVLDVDRREVKLELRGEGDERAWWVTVTRRPEVPEGQEQPAAEPTVDEFVAGSVRLEEYLPKIAPLRALRSLGELDDETATEVKLGDEAGRFVYTCGERTTEYAIGATAFGSGDRYLREQDGNTAYLLAADAVRDLQSAEALLMQRELVAFEWPDVEALVLRADDREQKLLQRNRREPERAEWVDADEPDRRNELFGNWLDRFTQLRVQDYLEPGAQPGSDIEGESATVVPVLTIEFLEPRDEPAGTVELVRVDAQPIRYYARSSATRAWVTVPRSIAQQVEDDARTILGLDPVVRPEPPAPPQRTPAATPDAGTATSEPPTDPHGHAAPPTTPAPAPAPQRPALAPQRPATPALPPGHP